MNYDYDKMVPVYGFGAKPHFPNLNSNEVLHCFPLTGDPNNSQVFGLEGLMDVYSKHLRLMEFSGPTFFAPLFREAMNVAQVNKMQNNGVYTILLVLTDGEIHDMDKTIEMLFQMALLPISIIIIGVGNENFQNMETLDADNGLVNSRGQKIARDLVQFVPFKKFSSNMELLSKEVLAEIPAQIVQYYVMHGIKPSQPQQVDISQLVPKTQNLLTQKQGLLGLGAQLGLGNPNFGVVVNQQVPVVGQQQYAGGNQQQVPFGGSQVMGKQGLVNMGGQLGLVNLVNQQQPTQYQGQQPTQYQGQQSTQYQGQQPTQYQQQQPTQYQGQQSTQYQGQQPGMQGQQMNVSLNEMNVSMQYPQQQTQMNVSFQQTNLGGQQQGGQNQGQFGNQQGMGFQGGIQFAPPK